MSAIELELEPHPLLRLGVLATRFPRPLRELDSPPWLRAFLDPAAEAPLRREESVRAAIRDLLRHGGYKPTGRGKPSSEYLLRAAATEAGGLASINLAVDLCNAVSLHAGLPLSVVDLDRTRPPLRVRVAGPGERYVFNASGQEIDLGGLVSLADADGPCANAVKDAQRTKTGPATTRTLTLVWACAGLEDRLAEALRWSRELAECAGAACEP